MADPIRWKSKVLLAKIEATYGLDPAPTGVANAILATDVVLAPMEGDDVSRNLERPYLGGQETIPVALHSTLTFSTELAGSGAAGTAPLWGVLARACGCAEVITAGVSVAYSPISLSMESVTFYFWIGTVKHVMKGARGKPVSTLNAQGIPVIRWTFMSLFTMPVDAAQAVPTLAAWQEPLVATKANTPTFTINGVALVLRSFTFDFGNDVQQRLLVGKEEILIVDRAETLACQVEAVALATFNPFALAQARTLVPVNIVHGTVAGNIVTIAAPTAQVQRLSGYENQQNVLEWPLRVDPKPNAGNDQFSITCT
jgi:tail tube protein